ncbi:MAG TPA: hypothetical protein VKJ65_00155 [Phycisphaerae bacterium]|nr:hypothetical protein [Phycisphaerae bacterium]
MKIEFDADEVKRQLQRLHDALPEDDVDIWVKCIVRGAPAPTLEYTVYIRHRDEMESVCGDDSVLAKAVDEALTKSGPRGNEARIRAKRLAVKQAMAELKTLEIEAAKEKREKNP